jgi:tRNA U34 5-carboxymethylaminomethyl modifying GTPase MnmE/TrmE
LEKNAAIPTFVVLNKLDLLQATGSATWDTPTEALPDGWSLHRVSCQSGLNLPELVSALTGWVAKLCRNSTSQGISLARQRQRIHLESCAQALARALVHPAPFP